MNELTKSIATLYLESLQAKQEDLELNETKKLDPVGKEDGDIDNDGDEDESDDYLKNRRKAISKSIKKDDAEDLDEVSKAKAAEYHKLILKAIGKTKLPKDHGYKSSVANNGDFVVVDGGGRTVGRIKKGDFELPSQNEGLEEAYDYKCGVEKTKNGFRAQVKNAEGKVSYLGQTSYDNEEDAKGEAKAYAKAYFDTPGLKGNDRGAAKAVKDYRAKVSVNEETDLQEAWSDGVSSRNASRHAKDSAQYRKKADAFASKAKKHDKGSKEHSEHMADHHLAIAKAIKSSYHSGQGGPVANAKRAHKSEMAKAKEFKTTNEETNLDEAKKVIQDLGGGVKAVHETDGGITFVQKDSMGKNMVILEAKQVNMLHKQMMNEDKATGATNQLDELGNKYVMIKKDLADVQSKINSMKNPPKVIKDRSGYFHLKTGNTTVGPFHTMKAVLDNLNEDKATGATADLEPTDATRDTWSNQLLSRKGEKDFVDKHSISTPDVADGVQVNSKTLAAIKASGKSGKGRWNDQATGDAKPVKNDGK